MVPMLFFSCIPHPWTVCQAVSTTQESNHSERESSHEIETDSGAQPRPAISSGYSKQFQKSLPPRFQRQQVKG